MKKIILSAIAVLGLSAATTELPSFDDTTVVLHKGWNLVGSDSAVNLVKDLNNSAIKIAWRWHNGNWEAFSLNKVTTNTVKEENIDDTEEYLNIRETTIHVKINKTLIL